MFNHNDISRAVTLSQCSYRLRRWLNDVMARGVISTKIAHSYAEAETTLRQRVRADNSAGS